jgi:hypothetical protein
LRETGRFLAELMAAMAASRRVNSVRNDDSGLLVPDDPLAASPPLG